VTKRRPWWISRDGRRIGGAGSAAAASRRRLLGGRRRVRRRRRFGRLVMLTYDVLDLCGAPKGARRACAHFPQIVCNLGAAGERGVDADRGGLPRREFLREHGVSVVRLPADFAGKYNVGAAVFIHFDGSNPPCRSSASVGYARSSDAAGGSSMASAIRAILAVRFSIGQLHARLARVLCVFAKCRRETAV